MDDRDSAAGLVGGSDRRGCTGQRPAGRLGDRPDHRACVWRRGAGRQLRLRRAAPRKRRATHAVAFSVSRSSLTGAPVAPCGRLSAETPRTRRGPRERLPVADVAVLHPRDLRRRSVGERRRQGEDLLARHPASGGQRRCRRDAADAEARRVDPGAPELERGRSIPGSSARSTRTTCSATPGSR